MGFEMVGPLMKTDPIQYISKWHNNCNIK